jgi:hypothetical protein
VLDPFMGSGTTGVAAVAEGRTFIGIERDVRKGGARMRLAGQAVAGYFPTPVHLVPRIARLLAVDWTAKSASCGRYTEALADRGVLVFLVPFYALAASANTLAQHFTDLHCFRFPEGDFEVFKQVVLVARRHASLRQPDPALVARVRAWSEDAASMPVLPARPAPVASLPDHPEYPEPLDGWEVAPMDLTGLLAEVQPWTASDRGGRAQPIPGVTPPADGSDLLARSYPTAMPRARRTSPPPSRPGCSTARASSPTRPAAPCPRCW